MLNGIFVFLIVISILLAAITGQMQAVTDAVLQDSRTAVEISLKLIGVMAFFIGLMKVAEVAGMLRLIARAVAPLMRRLFPAVPPDHPAMSAMILNIASNMLGLGNAATPFGIKAMEELDKLNGEKGTASNAMVLFLAINTAGLAVLPTGVIGLRAAAGSSDAAAIFFPTWFASGCATATGILAAFALARLPRFRKTEPPTLAPGDDPAPGNAGTADTDPGESETGKAETGKAEPELGGLAPQPILWRRLAMWAFWLAFVGLAVRHVLLSRSEMAGLDLTREVMSFWVLPAIVAGMILFGWSRGVAVYEALVEGAKEGFNVAVRIIPFLVAILVAVGMFRASGGMEILVGIFGGFTAWIGMPAEALPMAILRPLSGSGALGVMVEAMNTYGPDSLIGYMVSTFQGSTETTFYVLAVYFGAVGVKRTRHALPACLLADTVGILAAVFIVNLMFG